ncbi:MAG: pantoate--beta-alanine ligase [Pseudanabaenaceae cyanobacterium bins.68]|nr:pantoate--beta-alanine ligase [Pseudanabaenaceae cyanobacterium bins.68]
MEVLARLDQIDQVRQAGSRLGLIPAERSSPASLGLIPTEGSAPASLGLIPAEGSAPASLGLIPTMGALHQGHLSLIERSRHTDQLVAVSIFVNPRQFAAHEDLATYPRSLDQDLQLCEQAGVDFVFAPDPSQIWPNPNPTLVYPPPELTEQLCGRSRPGHFIGVATIVLKLLNIFQPDRAYFGEKDAQQLAIIQRLVQDLNLPVKIIPCPIYRDPDGLALSSRNQYLTPSQRQIAPQIYASLRRAQTMFQQGERQAEVLIQAVLDQLPPPFQLDYLELVDQNTLQKIGYVQSSALLAIAVYLGTTRLIDNIVLAP